MASHYAPYGEHHKIKKLVHKSLTPSTAPIVPVNSEKKQGKSVLLVIDVQNDFLPGGSLPVMGHKQDKGVRECEMMINSINELILSNAFDFYVFVQDVHPSDHSSLASTHRGKAPFDVVSVTSKVTNQTRQQVLWPDHCQIKDSSVYDGVALSDKLVLPFDPKEWKTITNKISAENPIVPASSIVSSGSNNKGINTTTDAAIDDDASEARKSLMNELLKKSYIMWKGVEKDTEPYSSFKNFDGDETGLRRFLTSKGVKDVYVCGLARDLCVWWSCADGTTYEYIDVDGSTKKEFSINCVLDASIPVPGSIKLPDYDPEGSSPHQEVVKRLTPESVHGDVEKNNVEGNSWVKAFLEPYGIKAVSWVDTIDDLSSRTQSASNSKVADEQIVQKGGSIFVKGKVAKKSNKQNRPHVVMSNGADLDFLRALK
ncbi:bifunctional nicotinamidase/pyrazinamidase [Yasminevirus sp. GU-2018]|uniref:Bifunctional nicotinamidase/pyrazinamidase n=1 Tax=Yasminevirus sp. GU-2018 TaxID=2420051 RepID=A0A5K0UAF5_9VIRU|nr:bifunctional nicotinamidase/pyrazinamidase [Yasminevirus sp. GU-2018]